MRECFRDAPEYLLPPRFLLELYVSGPEAGVRGKHSPVWKLAAMQRPHGDLFLAENSEFRSRVWYQLYAYIRSGDAAGISQRQPDGGESEAGAEEAGKAGPVFGFARKAVL